MARKDIILKSFLNHSIIKEKYGVIDPIPDNVRDALDSDIPVIKAIGLIVESLETSNTISDAALYRTVTQYLNSATI